MNKLICKILSMIITFIMMLNVLSVGVFAEDTMINPAENKATTVQQTFTFQTDLVLSKDTLVPNATISYTIQGETQDGSGRISGPSGPSIAEITFSHDDEVLVIAGNQNEGIVSKNVTVTFPENTFTKVGIYRYKISQVINCPGGGLLADTPSQYLDVYVQNGTNDDLEVTYFVLASIENNSAGSSTYNGKSAGFRIHYTTHDLTVKKEVRGNQGDKTKRFTFQITITNSGDATKKYTYKINNLIQDGTFVSGSVQEIYLAHNDQIEILGLTDKDQYTIKEVTEADYETKYKIGTTTDEQPYTQPITGSQITEDVMITIINIKDVVAPTGLIMTFAPYVLMIILAIIVAVVFLNRKKHHIE